MACVRGGECKSGLSPLCAVECISSPSSYLIRNNEIGWYVFLNITDPMSEFCVHVKNLHQVSRSVLQNKCVQVLRHLGKYWIWSGVQGRSHKVKPDGSSLQQCGVQNVSRLFSPQTGGKYVNFILIILNNNTWLLITASDRARTTFKFFLKEFGFYSNRHILILSFRHIL